MVEDVFDKRGRVRGGGGGDLFVFILLFRGSLIADVGQGGDIKGLKEYSVDRQIGHTASARCGTGPVDWK